MLLVAAATQRELAGAGDAATLVCGVGPVEAALHTASELARARPAAILLVGVAGGRTFDRPAFVVGSEAVYCDADDPRWIELRVPAASSLLETARRALPDARVEPIGTSARVGGSQDDGRRDGRPQGCEVEAMEGYAVLRAASLAGVPALEVRVLANAIGEADRANWRLDQALDSLAERLPALIEAVDGAL